jgi:hypothetical protein
MLNINELSFQCSEYVLIQASWCRKKSYQMTDFYNAIYIILCATFPTWPEGRAKNKIAACEQGHSVFADGTLSNDETAYGLESNQEISLAANVAAMRISVAYVKTEWPWRVRRSTNLEAVLAPQLRWFFASVLLQGCQWRCKARWQSQF